MCARASSAALDTLTEDQLHTLSCALHPWLTVHRQKVGDGSATARAIDHSLKRRGAPTRYLADGQLPIDNKRGENAIRPIALGRKNGLFARSLRAGQRAAAIRAWCNQPASTGMARKVNLSGQVAL